MTNTARPGIRRTAFVGTAGLALSAFTSPVTGSASAALTPTAVTVVAETCPRFFDANADGYPDLPVGSPREDEGNAADAGVVTVVYGGADGQYGSGEGLKLTQETVGQTSEKGDRFGAALAVGDVTGDACVDLVVGAPGEDKKAGQVVVVHSSPTGLAGTVTVLRQGHDGTAGTAEADDAFGAALSIGRGDVQYLWVGAPLEDVGRAKNAGAVTKLRLPLSSKRSAQLHQDSRYVPGAAETGDHFGAALSGGGELIGVPGEDVGRIVDAGMAVEKQAYGISQAEEDVPGTAERGDRFGAAVLYAEPVYWDFVQGGLHRQPVPLIGAPGEDLGTTKDAGSITALIYLGEEAEYVAFAQPGDPAEAGDRFGASLALVSGPDPVVEDFEYEGPDPEQRLWVGAPGEDMPGVADVGSATSYRFQAGCTDDQCYSELSEPSTRVGGTEPLTRAQGAAIGTTLGALPGVPLAVVVGSPAVTVDGKATAGAVTVLPPAPGLPQVLSQASAGVPGGAEAGDGFGVLPSVTELSDVP